MKTSTMHFTRFRERLRHLLTIFSSVMPLLLVPIIIILYLALFYRCSHLVLLTSILLMTAFSIKSRSTYSKVTEKEKKQVLKLLILAGSGLSHKVIKLKVTLFINLVHAVILLASLTLFNIFLGYFDKLLAVILAILVIAAVFIYYSTHLILNFKISNRKTSIDVEAPYFFIMVNVLSSISMPFYDILSIVEKSASLKAFPKDIKFAKKISTIKNLSLLSALDVVYRNHPSEIVRDYVRRIVIAASTIGDIRSVVESSFDAVYTAFESRISKLTEKFTIIMGSALFAYLFIPIIVAAIAPVLGGGILQIAVAVLGFQLLTFFVLYGISTSYYPSSLVIGYTKTLLISSALSLALAIIISIYNIVSYLAKLVPLDNFMIIISLVISALPGVVVSEKVYRRALLYDKFTRVASDAASLAIATGENYLQVLERTATRYGKEMTRFVKRISASYTSDVLRKTIINSAPSIFHASFIETLMYILLYGSSPAMLKSFTSSYERVVNLVSRVRGMAASVEAMLISLSAMIGGFLTYLDKVFKDIAHIASESGASGMFLARFFTYDPELYGLLNALTVFSLVLVSVFIGKIRGGTIAFSFRSAVISLVLYFVVRMIVQII